MRVVSRPGGVLLLAAVALFAVLWIAARHIWLGLGDPAYLTGYILLALMLLLALFNARKRLSMVPLGRASVWLTLHVVGGLLVLALFWLHTGTALPSGTYEIFLTLLVYLVAASGIVGFLIQLASPPRLTRSGDEIIYERIPAELARLREEAQALVLACAEKTGSDALARHYDENLHWYFRRPRFFLSNVLGSLRAQHWLANHAGSVARYLSAPEREFHDRLCELAGTKSEVDAQYALQSLMKWWLFFHVPPSAALVVFALWHLVVVNLYAM